MYLRRHCYDKPWRCPGWAGGGWGYAKKKRCDGGGLDVYGSPDGYTGTKLGWEVSHWHKYWRFSRCNTCDVRAIPYGTQWLDPSYLWWRLKRWPGNLREAREWRRYQKLRREAGKRTYP